MLSRDLRVTGFSTSSWLRVLSLFGTDTREPLHTRAGVGSGKRGSVIVIENADGTACAAFHTERGAFPIQDYSGRDQLDALCERHLARRAIVLRRFAIEELTERAALRVLRERDYAAQWLALLSCVRELEAEGLLHFWPPRSLVPLPTPAMLTRALDLLLPNEHSFVAMLWENSEIWTALVLRRRAGELDLIAGPELVVDITGPLGGDYRRDHRIVSRAVSRSIAPVHIGLYAQRERFERLLRDPDPGAWAKAVALRDILIDPAPPYAHVAVGADALRASARRTSQWLGGLDLLAPLTPLARYARDRIGHVASITSLLGFNPLEVLASRLRTGNDEQP